MGEVKQTTQWSPRELFLCAAIVVPITIALQPSTGSQETKEYYSQRRVDDVPLYYRPSAASPTADAPTAAKFIASVQRAFRLPISELASHLGVSRPTIYAWMRGGNISSDNIVILERFARASEVLLAAGLEMNPIVRDRKLPGGKTLLASIAAGTDGEIAALSLVTMLDAEAQRRQELVNRFKGRPKRNAESDDESSVDIG